MVYGSPLCGLAKWKCRLSTESNLEQNNVKVVAEVNVSHCHDKTAPAPESHENINK